MSYFDKVRVVIFAHQNRARSKFLEFLLIVEGGRTLDKRIPEGLFLTFSDKVRVLIFADQNRVRSMFLQFLLIVAGGQTLDKRIPERLF